MKYKYTGIFDIGDGKVYARIPDLPGCVTTGKDLDDAVVELTDAASLWLVVAEDRGDEIPEATPQSEFQLKSGTVCSFIKVDTDEYRLEIEDYDDLRNVS